MSKIAASALAHLGRDEKLAQIISDIDFTWGDDKNLFASLIECIISQQLSNKVEEIITKRFWALFKKGRNSAPRDILSAQEEEVRHCGISWAKVRYIRGVAQAVLDQTLVMEKIPSLSDEAVIVELTKLKGIGRWSAEMILIFDLHRPDVFSLGDLGLRTAVAKLYGIDRNDLKKIERLSRNWSPYRSLASRFLWRSLNNAG